VAVETDRDDTNEDNSALRPIVLASFIPFLLLPLSFIHFSSVYLLLSLLLFVSTNSKMCIFLN